MKLHEYQAKRLLSAYGVQVPDGRLAETPRQAGEAYLALDSERVVVKAQVHCGGRGKAGGIHVVNDLTETKRAAKKLLGTQFKSAQSGSFSLPIQRVLIEPACAYVREMYVGMLIDRQVQAPVLLVSPAGGMDIEQLAVKKPELLLTLPMHPTTGIGEYQVRHAASFLQLPRQATARLSGIFHSLERALWDMDTALIEINPLVLTAAHELIALDCKLALDEAALFRHTDLVAMADVAQEQPRELRARQSELAYVALQGTIGCMVNGAGLAMATMDLIKSCGGHPANFLDIGGSATQQRVAEALCIICEDDAVQAILINIFGGIVRCDMVAEGVVAAAHEVGLQRPLVIRLQGTNSQLGRAILEESDLHIIAADSLLDAAQRVVEAARNQ